MTAPVILPAKLDSAGAVHLTHMLKERQGTDVVLDAAAVDLLGARALQTLLVSAASWQAAGRSLSVANLSAGVRMQLSDLGFADSALFEGAAE
jgi:anti-anti-sigma regulatory factor